MATNKLNITRGDTVMVLVGKDRSTRRNPRRGRVIGTLPNEDRVIVEGINIVKRAVRRTQKMMQGGIVQSPGPIHVSNVMLVCPSCEKPTRVGRRRRDDGSSVRYCKRCDRPVDD